MLLTTTESVPGKSVQEIIGVVSGCAVYTMDGSAAPEELYNDAVKRAVANLEKEAGLIDVDSVIGLHTAVTSLGANQIIVTVTGTAVALGLSDEEKSENDQKKNKIEEMRRERKEEEQERLSADEAPEVAASVAASVETPVAADDSEDSALEKNLLNLLLKNPEGMDGVGISKKIPRIYYSPSEVSSALKSLCEKSKLSMDEFGVFRISGQQA